MNRRSIVILFIIFLLPMILAYLAFSRGYFFSQTTNRGQLIRPPVALSALKLQNEQSQPVYASALQGKWWMVYITEKCDEKCTKYLYYMRQIRQATGKNRDRVERALFLTAHDKLSPIVRQLLAKDYPGTQVFWVEANELKQLRLAFSPGYLYLVDPLGNIMMYYPQNIAPKGILKDLEHLLKVSQIG